MPTLTWMPQWCDKIEHKNGHHSHVGWHQTLLGVPTASLYVYAESTPAVHIFFSFGAQTWKDFFFLTRMHFVSSVGAVSEKGGIFKTWASLKMYVQVFISLDYYWVVILVKARFLLRSPGYHSCWNGKETFPPSLGTRTVSGYIWHVGWVPLATYTIPIK